MTPAEIVEQFVQDVYLTRFNRFIDDLTSEDGLVEIQKTERWTNMFLDELEKETDPNGQPMDWNFLRNTDVDLGTILTAGQTFTLPAGIRKLVVNENRPLTIVYDGAIVSRFYVVDPDQITRKQVLPNTQDRVTVIGNSIIFSREFKDYEIGGTVIADTIDEMPRLITDDATKAAAIETIVPYQLLILGVAKNATLPDIVQGGLSPSFAQKYADLLEQVKANNDVSSTADELVYSDMGYIKGIGF